MRYVRLHAMSPFFFAAAQDADRILLFSSMFDMDQNVRQFC